MNRASALAHPNIALVKYWGKQAGNHNIPATPSLSVTLDTLTTRTSVCESERDRVEINGSLVSDKKIEDFLVMLRAAHPLPPLLIESSNNFPTNAGLASSASGFAGLLTAIDAAFGLQMSPSERSIWARRGSGSAARSIFGGFVSLEETNGDWFARSILPMEAWALKVVVAITSETAIAALILGTSKIAAHSPALSPPMMIWLTLKPVAPAFMATSLGRPAAPATKAPRSAI